MSAHEDRKKLVEEKLRKEEETLRMITSDARELVGEVLKERGYLPDEIEMDPEFSVGVGDIEETVSTDFIVRPGGKRYIAIKCSMEMVSRERHILSFSRVVDSTMIPLSMVTDGISAHIMDTATGKTISEDLSGVPTRDDALRAVQEVQAERCPEDRVEKEKRILLAFESTGCPRPQPEEQA